MNDDRNLKVDTLQIDGARVPLCLKMSAHEQTQDTARMGMKSMEQGPQPSDTKPVQTAQLILTNMSIPS
jgi:hypothetical protein